jgi:hypothetical protein
LVLHEAIFDLTRGREAISGVLKQARWQLQVSCLRHGRFSAAATYVRVPSTPRQVKDHKHSQ